MKKQPFTRAEILEAIAKLALADEIAEEKEVFQEVIESHFSLVERVERLKSFNDFMLFVETKLKLYHLFLIESVKLTDDGYEILYRTLDI